MWPSFRILDVWCFLKPFIKGTKKGYKMVLVSDVLDHIGRIHRPLDLANVKIKQLKLARNTYRTG